MREDLYQVGLKKKSKEISASWEELNNKQGKPYTDGDCFRKSVDQEIKRRMKKSDKKFTKKDKCKGTKEGKEEIKPQYTDMGDYYRITNSLRSIEITKDKLRLLKELYCQEDGSLTVNQICRKLDIPRRDFFMIKNAFGITHDDVNFLDEDIINGDIDKLTSITLEKRKEQYFLKLQQKEIENMKIELKKYRAKDYQIDKINKVVKESLADIINSNRVNQVNYTYTPSEDAKLLEVDIFDVHLNKLAWNKETGEDYDSEIAIKRFKETIFKLKHRIRDISIERVIFPVGQDFFNIDTPNGTTEKGTRQDIDSRWPKMFTVGIELLVWAVNELLEIAPVYVFLVPGNHDTTTSFYAITSLYYCFKDHPDVTVDTNPQTRKYVWFGQNLIGFTHGDKERKNIEGNMQQEVPEAWAGSVYREWHAGHLHSEHARETNGIVIRNLSSITGADYWHKSSGYVGAIARTQIFLWDKTEGLWDMKYITIMSNVKNHVIKL